MKIKKFEDMECHELKKYCPWENEPVFCTGSAVSMCEGSYCKEAYENYLDYENDLEEQGEE